MSQYRVDFESIQLQEPAAGVRARVCEKDGKRLRLAKFSREFIEADWCTNGHIGYVVEGEFEIDFDGHIEAFGQGDGLYIPAGDKHKHKAKVLSETATLFLVEECA
jgi:hypothetical protein